MAEIKTSAGRLIAAFLANHLSHDMYMATPVHLADAEAEAAGIDVERLARALFEAERPGDWPTWPDYIDAFGTPGIAPWRRKAERIAAEYELASTAAIHKAPETR